MSLTVLQSKKYLRYFGRIIVFANPNTTKQQNLKSS